jgi:hypothetical protein
MAKDGVRGRYGAAVIGSIILVYSPSFSLLRSGLLFVS